MSIRFDGRVAIVTGAVTAAAQVVDYHPSAPLGQSQRV